MPQLRSVGSGTDVLSMSAKSSRASLPHVTVQPSYVSEAEAENLVYAEIERPVNISVGAIYVLNGFLDQILYDILSKSHSTALTAIRAAIPVVLKQRLGRAAIKAADEELQDYLDEVEMEEVQSTVGVLDPRADFDLDLSWKLTRLRCMVYAKLGDMEEEDEEEFLEEDDLREHFSSVKATLRSSAKISPPAAIFLTTVLEFLAEQALCIAAQHARKRSDKDAAREAVLDHQSVSSDVFVLEEIDMSGIGKEGPLIRLWRSWKGSMRSGAGSMSSRPTTPGMMSPISPDSPAQEWRFPPTAPFSTIHEERSPSIRPAGSPLPANIPLPISDNDIDEIEVPGLARTFEDDDEEQLNSRPTLENRRPSSMLIMPGKFPDVPTPNAPNEAAERPFFTRKRSRSVPLVDRPSLNDSLSQPLSEQSFSSTVISSRGETSPPAKVDRDSSRKEHSKSGSNFSGIGATVATIAGALNVEAAKMPRKDRPIHEDASPIMARSSINSVDDFERIHVPLRAATTVFDAAETGGNEEGEADPEDLALSSSDEDDAVLNGQLNPRDSGFGVVASDDDLPIQSHQQIPDGSFNEDEEDPAAGHDYNRHDIQAPASGPSTRSSNIGYVTIYQSPTTTASHSHNNSASNNVLTQEQVHSATSSTFAYSDMSPEIGTAGFATVIPIRTVSLDPQISQRQPTETRFPQHLPTVQRPPALEKVVDHPHDRVPRYATSAFAGGPAPAERVNKDQYNDARLNGAKDARPSTSGSTTARRQHLRLRADTEEAWPPPDLDRNKKSLDLLIDSDETLHYTLTPATATMAAKPKTKSQTQELADFFRNTAPPGEDPPRPKSSRSTKDPLGGLRSNPPASSEIPVPTNPKNNNTHPNDQQFQPSPSRPRNPVGEPRDARMVRNNTRDLADYMRSTGPENDEQLPKPLGTRPGTAQTARHAEPSLREKAMSADGDSRPATMSGKPSNRLKFQARDAQVSRTNESSDLIDFIREGPPRAAGDHRIDRKVAPFRSTMDSDDLNALAPPKDMDPNVRISDASAQESAITIKSMPSSMNSRTGLLDSTKSTGGKPNGVSSSTFSKPPIIPESDGMPKRTRRRVRDPYAIDFSDEEDEVEDTFTAPPQKAHGESLVDFLRNTAPPPGMTTQPILAAVPGPTQPDPANMVNQSTSSSKLKDYLAGSSPSKNGIVPKSSSARAESPHLTQVGSKMDKYRPTQPTHAAHVDRNRQKMRAEPRGATTSINNGTADLAAYLKASGPAPGTEQPVQKFNTGKDQVGFLKFFSRRGSVRK